MNKESEVQGNIVLFCRDMGFSVVVTSTKMKAPPGMKGHPDLEIFYREGDRHFHMYVECKAPGEQLRDSQIDWKQKHISNLPHWGYVVADDFGTFRRWLKENIWRREGAPFFQEPLPNNFFGWTKKWMVEDDNRS